MEGLAGSDIIGSAGSLDNALISCYVMLVVDDELSSVVKRTIQEIEVNDDNLAVDVVAEVIENQDNFLGHKHTRKYLRAGELWVPSISQRQTFEKWAQKGQKLEDVAKEKAIHLLATHQPAPLGSEIENEFDKILEGAKKALM